VLTIEAEEANVVLSHFSISMPEHMNTEATKDCF
jgi:hypothetical protein